MALVESQVVITPDTEEEWAALLERVEAVTDPDTSATIATDEIAQTIAVGS